MCEMAILTPPYGVVEGWTKVVYIEFLEQIMIDKHYEVVSAIIIIIIVTMIQYIECLIGKTKFISHKWTPRITSYVWTMK